MQRFDSDPYEQPPSYTSPRSTPSYPVGGPGLDTGLQLTGGGDGQHYSDPYVDEKGNIGGVSRVGPAASVQPYASLSPGIPAGSLFGGRGGGSAYRGRVPYQRSFSVELQENLRRRRKGRGLFG